MRANEFLLEVSKPWEIPPPGSPDFDASKESIRKIIQKVINDYSDALRNLLLSNKQQYLATVSDPQTIANNLNQAIFTSLINSSAGFITNDDIPSLQQTFSIQVEPSRSPPTTPTTPTASTSPPPSASSKDVSAPEPDSATNASQPSNELLTKAQAAIKGTGPKLTQDELKSINDWLESQGKSALPSSYAQSANPADAPLVIPTGYVLNLDPKSPIMAATWNGTAWVSRTGKAMSPENQKALTKIYTQIHKDETKTESLEEAVLNINKDTGELSVFPDEIDALATAATQVWYNNRAKGRVASKVQKILNPQQAPNLGKGGATASQPQSQSSEEPDKFFTVVGELLNISPNNKPRLVKVLTDIMKNPEQSKALAQQIKDRLSLD